MAGERSSLQGVGLGAPVCGDGRDLLGGQGEAELVEDEPQLGLRFGVAGQAQLAAVGGGHVQVDHLHELLDDAARGQSRGERIEASGKGYVEAIGEEGDKDVRLDAFDVLMEDRADGEVALDGLERLFDGDELKVIGPQIGGIAFGKRGRR